MLSFIFDFRLLLAALIAWFLFGANAGCKSMSNADAEMLRENLHTVQTFAEESGIEGEAELFISPNGSVSFGPGVNYSNGSYMKARLRFDPQKAALAKTATATPR